MKTIQEKTAELNEIKRLLAKAIDLADSLVDHDGFDAIDLARWVRVDMENFMKESVMSGTK